MEMRTSTSCLRSAQNYLLTIRLVFKGIVPTVVVYFFSVSQYRKYTQTNVRIHSFTKNWPIHTLSQYLYTKNRFIWRNRIFVLLHNNLTKHSSLALTKQTETNNFYDKYFMYKQHLLFTVFKSQFKKNNFLRYYAFKI